MKQYHLKDFNQKREDENLSFRVFDFTSATLAPYTICLLYTSDAADE